MAYNYLIDLYEIIEKRVADAITKLSEAKEKNSEEEIRYEEGRLEILREMERFLADNYNRMLPKKILKRLLEEGAKGIN